MAAVWFEARTDQMLILLESGLCVFSICTYHRNHGHSLQNLVVLIWDKHPAQETKDKRQLTNLVQIT
jgi:hypothetical protein